MSRERRDEQPLLSSEERAADKVLFSVGDEDDEYEHSALVTPAGATQEAYVPRPLRSTTHSRETGQYTCFNLVIFLYSSFIIYFGLEFELDEDDLDEYALNQLSHAREGDVNNALRPPGTLSRQNSEQRMPLLVGLLDTANMRGPSATHGISLGRLRREEEGNHASGDGTADVEQIARQRTAGGGLLDSIFNMANSILGAGGLYCIHVFSYSNLF